MSDLNNQDLQDFFLAGHIGFWKLEIEEGKAPRLYANSIMDSLLGIKDVVTPEARFLFHRAHIFPADNDTFNEYSKNLLEGGAEIIYRYLHPTSGEMSIRCGGKRVESIDPFIRIVGYHQEISDIIHLEQSKTLENYLVKSNRNLRQEQIRQDLYYKELLDLASCGVMAYTLPGYQLLHMNKEAMRIFDVKDIVDTQEHLEEIFTKAIYEDQTVLQQLKKLRHQNGSLDFSCMIMKNDKSLLHILAKTEVFATPNGQRAVVTTFLDVSKSVMLEKEKNILEALSIDYTSVFHCDLFFDTMITLKTDESDYALRVEQLLLEHKNSFSYRFKTFYENFVIKESAPDFLEKINHDYLIDFLSENKRFCYRFQVNPNSSGLQHFEMQIVKLNSKKGFQVVLGFRSIDDIIHEQELQKKKLETALTEAKLNNEIIGAISKIYWNIYHIDLETGTYNEISTESEEHHLTGFSGKITDVFHQTIETAVAPEFKEAMREFMDISTLSERLKHTESISMEMKTVFRMWYLVRFIAKKRKKDGTVINVLYVVQAINGQKKKELEYQEKLRLTMMEAQKANIAKTDFLRRMSHDIRTPINGILGMLTIADHYPNDIQKQGECRTKIKEASGFLLDLVNHILDMNKLESGNVTLDHKPFDLLQMLHELFTIIQMNAQEYAVSLHISEFRIKHRHLLGSPVHLRQIFQNITGNAVKYNRTGGSIFLSCREISCEEGKATFKFTCMDTGRGMSEEFQKHAFEPFSQESQQARSTYTGTGLGLAITKQLIDLMGGTLTMKSKLGSGTKFTIVQSFDIDDTWKKANPANEIQKELSLKGIHILLVEDNELNMEIAQFLLEKKGALVTTAWNGKEAVDLFLNSKPFTFDLILMDIMMPIMDGLTATKTIRSLKKEDAKSIPIFAMTANAFQEDIEQSKSVGMCEHLSKPLQEKELLTAILRYIKIEEKENS